MHLNYGQNNQAYFVLGCISETFFLLHRCAWNEFACVSTKQRREREREKERRANYLCKFCDNAELLRGLKGVEHFNDIFMFQLPQNLQHLDKPFIKSSEKQLKNSLEVLEFQIKTDYTLSFRKMICKH